MNLSLLSRMSTTRVERGGEGINACRSQCWVDRKSTSAVSGVTSLRKVEGDADLSSS